MEEEDDLEHDEYQPDEVDQHPTTTPASGSPIDRSKTRLPPASPSPSPSPSPAHPKLHGELWVCESCGKKFSSRKALGNHRRIHSLKDPGKSKLPQEQERDRVKQKAICRKLAREEENKVGSSRKTIEAGDVRGGNGGRSTCVCGKDFRSKYSLFGHMRSHPDRGWSGIKPPSNSNCDAESKNRRFFSSSDTSVSGAVGSPEVDDAPNVAAKIGNDPEGSPQSGWSNRPGQIVSFDAEMIQAAHNLMALSCDPRGFSGIKRRDEELTDSGLQRNRSFKKLEKPDQESEGCNLEVACDLENNVQRGYGKVVGEVVSNQKVLQDDCGELRDSESDRPNGLHKEEMIKDLKKRFDVKKKMKMNLGGRPGDREGVPGIGSYDPPEARRESFPTSQALGGHVINKAGELGDNSTLKDHSPIPDEKADLIPTFEANGEAIQNENNEDHAPFAAMETTFHCDDDSKTFQTGQALGWHNRCHSKAPVPKDSTPAGERSK